MTTTITFRTQIILITLACLIFGLQFGLNFAVSNQNHYLLPALKALHPELFTRDWIVNSTTNYHLLFPAIAKFLLLLSSSGWAFAIANVICSALVGLLIYFIIREIVEKQLLIPVFLTVIALCTLTQTNSAAGVYICSSIFQPSSLGALGFLAGILFFIRKQYLVSGICVALGGINHANYLMLAFPVFGVAHLLLGKDRLPSRLLLQFIVPAFALLPFIPFMLQIANSPDAALANHIYIDIRVPHHHNPRFFAYELPMFALGIIAGVLLGWKQLRTHDSNIQFRSLFIAMLVCIAVGLLLTTVVFSYSVARFMLWRTTPFVTLFAQILGATGVLKLLLSEQNNRWMKQIPLRVSVVVKKHLIPISICIWIGGGVIPLSLLSARSNLLSGFPKEETELYAWCRTTDTNALFAIPPLMTDFRIQSKRSVVVDWKPNPTLPSEVIEWYRRLEAISGAEGFTHLEMLRQGYNNMTTEQLQKMKTLYDINYAVLYKSQLKQLPTGTIAFQNEKFLVIAVE